jgi:hypoxanthine phosphoribosyltransferase
VTWDQVVSWCEALAKQLKGKGFKSILAIARGGLVPARLLSTFLGDLPVWAITCQRYTGTTPGKIKISGSSVIKHLIPPVLIVDEICDAGKTLQVVTNLMRRKKIPFEVAVLLMKGKARGQVDISYYAGLVDTDPTYPERWYCFPWESEYFDLKKKS